MALLLPTSVRPKLFICNLIVFEFRLKHKGTGPAKIALFSHTLTRTHAAYILVFTQNTQKVTLEPTAATYFSPTSSTTTTRVGVNHISAHLYHTLSTPLCISTSVSAPLSLSLPLSLSFSHCNKGILFEDFLFLPFSLILLVYRKRFFFCSLNSAAVYIF